MDESAPRSDERWAAFTDEFNAALRESDLAQNALADQAGVSKSYVNEIKTGKARNVSLDIVVRLEEALGCEPGRLLRHLGFVPTSVLPAAEDAVMADEALPADVRRHFADLITKVKRMRGTGQGA